MASKKERFFYWIKENAPLILAFMIPVIILTTIFAGQGVYPFGDSIYLRSYGQSNPLQEYVNEGYKMFSDMLELIAIEVILNLENCRVRMNPKVEENNEEAEQQPEEPKIESKNKEDKSLLDTTKKPTLTTKEN